MRAKEISEIKLQIERCFNLAKELGYEFKEYYPKKGMVIMHTVKNYYNYKPIKAYYQVACAYPYE